MRMWTGQKEGGHYTEENCMNEGRRGHAVLEYYGGEVSTRGSKGTSEGLEKQNEVQQERSHLIHSSVRHYKQV